MFTPELIFDCLFWYVVFVFSTCLHEAAHAWAAWRLGDPTAQRGGQVTLNPLPHIIRSPIGMVVIPLLSFFMNQGQWMIGWASAPYDPRWALEYPRRSALMALAGPAANLLLVIASGLLMRLGLHMGWFGLMPTDLSQLIAAPGGSWMAGLARILNLMFMLNTILLVFNLLPVPPLDGSGALMLGMNRQTAAKYFAFVHQPGLWMIGLIVSYRLFPKIFFPVWLWLVHLLIIGF